ncbi:amidase [Candidatus Chloroploca sp. Khr17]|uniref:amidase n=1 Tax=Candidatus Chloroploca sp. Khr17 TaxID=2496869 RepID=UPI00101D249C|nr:amidase [Candidatus Chloroploca sp. Khr17]
MSEELCLMTATELATHIRARRLSCTEVMQAHIERIERLNAQVNALVTCIPERALSIARSYDEALAHETAPSSQEAPLYGLPVAHKDLTETRGLRTTYGSPIFADYVPAFDALIVERLKRAGAITVGKTNTPEFGAGSQTFNAVFGATRNPYDLDKTCGGSSGGSAVALACRMLPLADGSDMGGSLRNPASFCNIVGFRTTPGRVPVWPDLAPYMPLSVVGPMARTVSDVALMLSAIAGPDPRAPLSLDEPGASFREPLASDLHGLRIAWAPDLGGLPVEPEVATIFAAQRPIFESLGCLVEDAHPDLSDADEIFLTLRAMHFELSLGNLLEEHRAQMKDTVIWNIEAGQQLRGPAIGQALRKHSQLLAHMRAFFNRYDAMVLPVSQVPPFPIEQPYVTEINGVPMQNYIEWMRSCYWISVTGQPALAIPGGFTSTGLPVGLQIVGRPRDERLVLRLGYAFEQATGYYRQQPTMV